MSHALLTMIAPLAPDRLEEARAEIDRLGNPATQAIRAALRPDPATGRGIHFASLHAIRSRHGDEAYLLLEISADGDERWALSHLVDAIGPQLRRVFLFATDWRDGADLAVYLRKRVVPVGNSWFGNPGVVFAGTPGFSVGRILSEGELAERVADLLAQQPAGLRGLDRLRLVREAIRGQADLEPMLQPAPGAAPFAPGGGIEFYLRLAGSFVLTYLWPLLLAVLAWGLFRGLREGSVGAFLGGLWNGAWMALLLTLILVGIGYARLRAAESSDAVDGRAPDDAVNAAIFARENRCRQNHMISITERKPGLLRGFTQRLVFWAIGKVAGVLYRPGFLGTIGSIHFARWITVPRSRNLVFLSNYGGSWESYLEDFITRAHSGLTGVWSNTVGFPRARNLVQGGATDSENFKRYARRSMEPTLFWYSAYPELTTAAIRNNAQIRRGLSGAMTEDEASLWLALFGSAERPAAKLVTSEIQSLLFGGLGFLPFGTCLVIDALSNDREEARQWLKTVRPWIAWNDGRRLQRLAVVTLGLGPGGLRRLGLADSGLAGFPFAFTGGMTGHGRAQILGDDPSTLAWGATPPDAALLVYGVSQADVDALLEVIEELCAETGATILRAIPLKEVTKDKSEPFGFVDGVSQPVIRGTYKGLRNADPIHLVEAGEFILGYPDNRGNMPPGPTLPAIEDPANLLPLVTRRSDFDENQARPCATSVSTAAS